MYESLIFIHSWTRWILISAIIYFFIFSSVAAFRESEWSPREENFVWILSQLLIYQALFGVTLWWGTSPVVRSCILNPRQIFADSLCTFWTVRHPLTMLAAVTVFLVGKNRINRMAIERRFKSYVTVMGIIMLLIFSAIPWPFMSYGRALLRGF